MKGKTFKFFLFAIFSTVLLNNITLLKSMEMVGEPEKGRLEVICGSMFSGKTEELLRRLKRAIIAKQKVLLIKPATDTRAKNVISHDKNEMIAITIDNKPANLKELLEKIDNDNIKVIGIDEIQFFNEIIICFINMLIQIGKRVIVTGLDMSFKAEPFGIMPKLLTIADEVTKLKAICVECGNDAYVTQRLVNGKPANYEDKLVLIGSQEEGYYPRCRNCYRMDRKPFPKLWEQWEKTE